LYLESFWQGSPYSKFKNAISLTFVIKKAESSDTNDTEHIQQQQLGSGH